jgi:adenylosuccinate lyase
MEHVSLEYAISEGLVIAARDTHRNLQMPGDPHYQPDGLKAYLGYDQRVLWQVIVEWFWMVALATCGRMPPEHAELLTEELLWKLMRTITTTKVAKLERETTKHDILALLMLMRREMPKELHRWLHWGLTSYDIVSTAFALQAKWTFKNIFVPKIAKVDVAWRTQIKKTAATLQIGRTHLQDALPITAGAWLAVLHNRFQRSCRCAAGLADDIPGKYSGAVGTSAAIRVLAQGQDLEHAALMLLGLPGAMPATQITQPEGLVRFYGEITLLSAVLANLGDDVRHLQSSAIGEVTSASSTSSTMSHKTANPIAAENMEGMHVSVRAAYLKVLESVPSTLQRDLRHSNVMRSHGEVLVYTFQQLQTAERLFRSFAVNETRCRENFDRNGKLVVAELLHLSLQSAGYPGAHHFVNTKVIPAARANGNTLDKEMDIIVRRSRSKALRTAWAETSETVRHYLAHPEDYLGDAIATARTEADTIVP